MNYDTAFLKINYFFISLFHFKEVKIPKYIYYLEISI